MTGPVNYYKKALEIVLWSPNLRPISPAPGDNCPLCPLPTPPTGVHIKRRFDDDDDDNDDDDDDDDNLTPIKSNKYTVPVQFLT